MPNLIDAAELAGRMDDETLRIVDVRFDLSDPSAGRRAYLEGHVPGAIYLHLDDDLSGPIRPDGLGMTTPIAVGTPDASTTSRSSRSDVS